jgi:hypothetical protein
MMGRCNKLLEACLQMNKGAAYAIKRGTGRQIDLEEAKTILLGRGIGPGPYDRQSGRSGNGHLQLLQMLLHCPVF